MRCFKALGLVLVALFASIGAAQATVQIHIDLSTQRMQVESSKGSHSWPVSTARAGYVTPRGVYSPTSLQKMHYSRKYHNSPMPHSIFFNGGYAIHGTNATGALGRPASHGCVRISPANAATLYKLVQEEGAQISITGSSPTRYAAHKTHRAQVAKLHRPHRSHALAYGPSQRYRSITSSVKSWQSAPMTSPFGY
ncbi:L,D-transpeptidase [Methylosinus sporium]|uniref:L,D-transpeptidase n=1 Tax=Methylosinus sporium TaxID=428 RepID=A0A2U1SVR3_METSR|nr:L,D-transpeptidase [Methylosinus sporium]PWB95714.1 L,D-transpeptidase [Methylosinus sporium]